MNTRRVTRRPLVNLDFNFQFVRIVRHLINFLRNTRKPLRLTFQTDHNANTVLTNQSIYLPFSARYLRSILRSTTLNRQTIIRMRRLKTTLGQGNQIHLQ